MYKKIVVLSFLTFLVSCNGNSQKKEAKTATVATKTAYKVTKTDAEWKAQLSPLQYNVLRKAGTETPFSSELLEIKEEGIYSCVACDTPLFRSEHKFKSGTGWPSFDRVIAGNVAFDVDYKIGYKRTEEHCAVCGGHLGHVFNDGPKSTTGERHCINGAALYFTPTKS